MKISKLLLVPFVLSLLIFATSLAEGQEADEALASVLEAVDNASRSAATVETSERSSSSTDLNSVVTIQVDPFYFSGTVEDICYGQATYDLAPGATQLPTVERLESFLAEAGAVRGSCQEHKDVYMRGVGPFEGTAVGANKSQNYRLYDSQRNAISDYFAGKSGPKVFIRSQCSAAALAFPNLRVPRPDPTYFSPNEPNVEYTRRRKLIGSMTNDARNALSGAFALNRYGAAIAQAYSNAALDYWTQIDQTGSPTADAEREYAYWILRRRDHSYEIGSAASFAGELSGFVKSMANMDSLEPSSLARTRSDIGQPEYIRYASMLDYFDKSQCHFGTSTDRTERLLFEEFQSEPWKYEDYGALYADQYRNDLQVERFSDEEFERLFELIKSGMSFQSYDQAKSSLSGNSDLSAAAVRFLDHLDRCSPNGNPNLCPIILHTSDDPNNWSEERSLSAYRYMLKPTFLGRNYDRDVQRLERVFLNMRTAEFQTPKFPMNEVLSCTKSKIKDAGLYFVGQQPDAIEDANASYSTNGWAIGGSDFQKRYRVDYDAARVALVACAQGAQIGEPEEYVAPLLERYEYRNR